MTNELTPEAGSGSATCDTHGPLCPHPSRCVPAETNERYELIVSGTGLVEIFDNEQDKSIAGFAGPDRLLAATAELNRLNEIKEMGALLAEPFPTRPAKFLAETLPALARRQRIEGYLAEVREIETALRAALAEDAANLKRATALREKLDALYGPLSATLPAQNAPEVGQDTSNILEQLSTPGAVTRGLFKPGPY